MRRSQVIGAPAVFATTVMTGQAAWVYGWKISRLGWLSSPKCRTLSVIPTIVIHGFVLSRPPILTRWPSTPPSGQ